MKRTPFMLTASLSRAIAVAATLRALQMLDTNQPRTAQADSNYPPDSGGLADTGITGSRFLIPSASDLKLLTAVAS